MVYERDMTIVFDPIEKWVVLSFRGAIKVLPGPFADCKEAIASGEAYCREQGWHDDEDFTDGQIGTLKPRHASPGSE